MRTKRTQQLVLIMLFCCLIFPVYALAASNISDTDKYAWSETSGWSNFNAIHGGVTVYSDHLTGFAWIEGIGFIKMGVDAGGPYANTNATDWGVNIDSSGNLSGYGWSEVAGWLNFNPTASQVVIDPNTGNFSGYAWCEGIGYIHLQNDNPAYKVQYFADPDDPTSRSMPWLMLLLGDTCDSSHLDLCKNNSTCNTAGGYWWSDESCHDIAEASPCDATHLDLCTTSDDCLGAGGYWWSDNTCNSADQIPTVTNTATGRVWMDRNLGASQVATRSDDPDAYGDLYQWGRGTDGHEKRTNNTFSNTQSDNPTDGLFIVGHNDWRVNRDDLLWTGVSAPNNPCPGGFRLPNKTELDSELASWETSNAAGAFKSPLKLVVAGYRAANTGGAGNGGILLEGVAGYIYSSTTVSEYDDFVYYAGFADSYNFVNTYMRSDGNSVRCIMD
ncbi:MAG: hypothetical protein GY702_21940 [Desulfobulbaceae bacterium]|nr:hypothetical protein [Desulfobulbaceae bacterium]